jgi:hypothetical protein
LYIGGTTVIDSNRNLVGINLVNQNLNFGSSYSIYNAAWVNATNLNASNTVYATRIYQNGVQVINTVNAGNGLTGGGSGPSVILSVNNGTGLAIDGSGKLYVIFGSSAGTAAEGNKQITISAGTGLSGGGTVTIGSGGSINLGINTAIVPRKDVADTINAPWTFAENVWFNKNVFIAGNLSYVNVNTLNVNGSLIPIFSNMFDVGNLTYKWRNVTAVNIVGDNVYGNAVYSGGNAVLTTATGFSNAAGSDISVSGNYNSLNLQINAGAVGTNEIADNAVTTAKIADRNVTLAKLNQTSCPAGQALQSIGGGTYACVDVNPTGTISGSGTIGYIPLWNGTYSLNSSVISQSGGNVVINSGNLNIQSGGLLIGGTTVIDSNKNIYNANWINGTNLYASQRIYSVNGYYVGNNQVIDSSRNVIAGSWVNGTNAYFTGTIYGILSPTGDINMNNKNIYNANWVNATNLYASQGIYSVNGYYVGNNQVITSGRIIQAADGSATSPAFTFNSETNTGMYRVSNGIIGFSTGGTQRVTISSSGLNIASGGLLIGGSTVIDSSRNANFASLQIGGTTVIDSNRNLVGINQVNQDLNFGSSYSIVNANWVNATNLNISGTARVNNLLIYTKTNCGKLYTDSSGNVLCGSDQGITQETDPYWNANISAISNNYLIKRSGAGIGQSIIYDNGTNVGIGTTTPSQILHIQKAGTDNYIKIDAGSTSAYYSGIMLTEYGINWGWSIRHNAGNDNLFISYQDNTPTFTDLVTFTRGGNVGIGTNSPASGFTLHVRSPNDGAALRVEDYDAYCNANPGASGMSWSCSSDVRFKENIRDAPPILDKLMKIPIRQFELKSTGETKIGVIGQELQQIMPELVSKDENGYLMVSELSSWQLIKALQEQQQQIQKLQQENQQLKALVCLDHPEAFLCQ